MESAWSRASRRSPPDSQASQTEPAPATTALARRDRATEGWSAAASACRNRIESDFPAGQPRRFCWPASRVLPTIRTWPYAGQYLEWLAPIRDLDAQHGNGDFALLRETGRYLALWMSYEDAVRVADLKIRRSRFDRVQRRSLARAAAHWCRSTNSCTPRSRRLRDILPAGLAGGCCKSRWAKEHDRAVHARAARSYRPHRSADSCSFTRSRACGRCGESRCVFRKRRSDRRLARAGVARSPPRIMRLRSKWRSVPQLLKGYGETPFARTQAVSKR